MARVILSQRDYVVDDPSFLQLGLGEVSAGGVGANELSSRVDLDVARSLQMLKDDPSLAALFLARTGGVEGNGSIYWAGEYAGIPTSDGMLGVRFSGRNGMTEVVGDNLLGRFFEDVRRAYRDYLRTAVVNEVPIDESLIVTDLSRRASYESEIEGEERIGRSFIHVDASRSAEGGMDGEADFQRFTCPFGTSYPARLIVGSAAEASYLYEQAIRGDLDWRALMRNLTERDLFNKNVTDRQKDAMVKEFSSQFSWMREQILTNPNLRTTPIVAPSRMVADTSFGRSVYDVEHAPSPAHVLKRYIDNPLLLFSSSENGVVRSLVSTDKDESLRFHVQEGSARILVVASDTLGGREPGGRNSTKVIRRTTKDENGHDVISTRKVSEIPRKTKAEMEKDYAAFKMRMGEVLPEGRVQLVTGSASTLADTIGIGGPDMTVRYVRENGGSIYSWDYSKNKMVLEHQGTNESLSVLKMEHFSDSFPVLCGAKAKLSFLLDRDDADTEVSISGGTGPLADAAVVFSDTQDSNVRNVLALGSYAASAGLPVIHVQDNRSEAEQLEALREGVVMTRSFIMKDGMDNISLFEDGVRTEWDLGGADVMSVIDTEHDYAVPFVSQRYDVGVGVGGFSFSSVYGVYAALLAQELHVDKPDMMGAIRNAEGSTVDLAAVISRMTGGEAVDPVVQERCLRRSVRLFTDSSEVFTDALLATEKESIVMPSSVDDRVLFTGLDGKGENRFGVVLTAERDYIREAREARRIAARKERDEAMKEIIRKQKSFDLRTMDGKKVIGGLPGSLADASDAIWFIGTNRPIELALPDDGTSFQLWETRNSRGDYDPLTRAKAGAARLDDGAGGKVPNDYVFVYGATVSSLKGSNFSSPRKDSTDLTGLTREDPKTGQKFDCAYGVPVRFNKMGIEPRNKEMMPSSYFSDAQKSELLKGLIAADCAARYQAMNHDMSLCMAGRRDYKTGKITLSLCYHFADKVFRYDKETGTKDWYDNPHRAPLLMDIMERYTSLLVSGKNYPLNLIPFPQASYSLDAPSDSIKKTALSKAVADLNLSLDICTAISKMTGKEVRFPLDKDGNIDFGPGMPKEFWPVLQTEVDNRIGVVKKMDVREGILPLIERIDTEEGIRIRQSSKMEKAGSVEFRPNELVAAFGMYDFNPLVNGSGPLHEMMFKMGDDYFYLYDTRLSRGRNQKEIEAVLDYTDTTLAKFNIKSTNPALNAEFTSAFLEYLERANAIDAEFRLVRVDDVLNSAFKEKGGHFYTVRSDDGDLPDKAFVVSMFGKVPDDLHVSGDLSFLGDLSRDLAASFVDGKISEADFVSRFRSEILEANSSKLIVGLTWLKDQADDKAVYLLRGDSVADFIMARETERFINAHGLSCEKFFPSVENYSLEGFVRVLDSNSLDFAVSENEIGRIPTHLNMKGEGSGIVGQSKQRVPDSKVMDEDGTFRVIKGKESVQTFVSNRDTRGNKIEAGYDGREPANDGGEFYVQVRYRRPDGNKSEWQKVRDLDVAKEVVMYNLERRYGWPDGLEPPSRQVYELMLKHEAMGRLVEEGGFLQKATHKRVERAVEDKVVEIERSPVQAFPAQEVDGGSKESRLYVSYYGNNNIPEDAYRVQISNSAPKDYEVDVYFKSAYPDYNSMVKAVRDGTITEKEYAERYRSQVLEPNKEKILSGVEKLKEMAEGSDIYFLCYEKPGDFCHRYLFSNFLNEMGVKCEECPDDRKRYVSGKIPLSYESVQAEAGSVRFYEGNIVQDGKTVFVFGSNPEGRHGAGAAKVAVNDFGAEYGKGEGMRGQSYAIPTKDLRVKENGGLRSISPEAIVKSIRRMYECASASPELDFKVAYRNTDKASLNGYTGFEMMDMFLAAGPVPENVVFSREWVESGSFAESVLKGRAAAAGLSPAAPAVVPVEAPAVPDQSVDKRPGIVYTESSNSNYAQRTRENATADDVDFTFAFAIDFTTREEVLTRNVSGDSYIPIQVPLLPDGKGIDLSAAAVERCVKELCSYLPDDMKGDEPLGINIAGNGMFTASKFGVNQKQCDLFVVSVLSGMEKEGFKVGTFRSCGQTGFGETAVAVGSALDVPVTIHAPKGFVFMDAEGNNVRGEEPFKARFNRLDTAYVNVLRKIAGRPVLPFEEKKNVINNGIKP